MNLSEEVDLEDYVARPDRISGADINAICQEAGMHAVRENRYIFNKMNFNGFQCKAICYTILHISLYFLGILSWLKILRKVTKIT